MGEEEEGWVLVLYYYYFICFRIRVVLFLLDLGVGVYWMFCLKIGFCC